MPNISETTKTWIDRWNRGRAATRKIAEKLGCPDNAVVVDEELVRLGIDAGTMVAVSLDRLEVIAERLPVNRSRGET